MAMVTCRECKAQVSTEAKTCPNCGVASPAEKPRSKRGLVIVLLLILFWAIWRIGSVPSSPVAADADGEAGMGQYVIAQAKTFMQGQLKDPQSVQWGRIDAHRLEKDGKTAVVACGSYNSKNALGGYTGSRRFISNGTADMTFSEEAMGSEFELTWNTVCAGPVVASSQ